MRRLVRIGLVEPLKSRVDQWNTRYTTELNVGQTPSESLLARYRDPDLKTVLREETKNKCAYCESYISHIYPGDVEHIEPKSASSLKRLDYDNLTIACWQCNNNKDTYYDILIPIINPFVHDPEDHLIAIGSLVYRKPSDPIGLVTETVLKLNRTHLAEARRERLERLLPLADLYQKETDPSIKYIYLQQLLIEAGEDKEYTLVVRSYLRYVLHIAV